MSCCGLWNWMGCNRTELTTVKMALFAPMPRARARTETQAKPGLRARVRAAYLRSRRAEVNTLHILNGVAAFLPAASEDNVKDPTRSRPERGRWRCLRHAPICLH